MRIQVNVSDEMCAELDKYSKSMGVSRSALCSMFIGQGIMAYNKSLDMWQDMGEQVIAMIEKDVAERNRKNGKGESKVGKR